MDKTWAEQIREAAIKTGMSPYKITKETGLFSSQVHEFMVNGKGLSADNLEVIGRFLGFSLCRPKKFQKSENKA